MKKREFYLKFLPKITRAGLFFRICLGYNLPPIFSDHEVTVTQDVDIQLQVWKDLAISKQVLMSAATDALGLDAECSTEELKAALDKAIQRANEADINIKQTREQADQAIAAMQEQLEAAQKAQREAEAKVESSEKARAAAEHQLNAGKADNAEALKKAKAEVVKKQNELKAISKALADTPENVVKKLKNLKKQKMDEASAKKEVEKKLQSLRKDHGKLEADFEGQKAVVEKANELAGKFRELHALCTSAAEQAKDVDVPTLDEEFLAIFETDEDSKKGSKAK